MRPVPFLDMYSGSGAEAVASARSNSKDILAAASDGGPVCLWRFPATQVSQWLLHGVFIGCPTTALSDIAALCKTPKTCSIRIRLRPQNSGKYSTLYVPPKDWSFFQEL